MSYGSHIAEGIGVMILMAVIVTAIVVASIVGGVAYLLSDGDEVVTDEKLEPTMVITISDGVPDTTYIYNTKQ